MLNFFKEEDKKPFTYSSIEMRKSSGSYILWILGCLVLFVLAGFLFLKSGKTDQNHPRIVQNPSPIASSSATLNFGQRTKTSNCVSVNGLPDKGCTPGDIDPKVTQDNINQTICISGYTKIVRPPVSYTNELKIKQIQEYGYSNTNPKDYEEDHLISLELGGSPTSEANLWPEQYNITLNAKEKDKVENYLHDQICSGKMTLFEAQIQISNNWEEVYQKLP